MRYTKAQKAEIGRRQRQRRSYYNILGEVTKTVYVCKGCDRICTLDDFEVDHIIPVSLGGPDTLDNKQLLCSKCNKYKGNAIVVKGKLVRMEPRTNEKKPSTLRKKVSTTKRTASAATRKSSPTKKAPSTAKRTSKTTRAKRR